MKLYCEHHIPLAAEQFWSLIHTPAYEALVAQALGLSQYQELDRKELPDSIYRRLRAEADWSQLPAPAAGLLKRLGAGQVVSYVEEQWRSQSEMRVRFAMTPSILTERTRVEGHVEIRPLDANSCLRVLDGDVEVRLPGLGRRLEKTIVSNAVSAYGKSAVLTETFSEAKRA